MSVVDRADLSRRRARAGRIREGMKSYIHTLAEIANAYAERDWEVLGYDGWDAYVDEEFGADRLRLTPEHRQKAVQELRLAGLSQRAIGSALNVDQKTVRRDLAGEANASPGEAPTQVKGIDGKTYQTPARRDSDRYSIPGPAVIPAGEPDQPEEVAAVGEDAVAASSAEPPAGSRNLVAEGPSPDRPGLDEFINEDPRVQAADYLVAFTSALSRAGGFMQFDAERLGQLAGSTTWDAIEAHASVVAHWYDTAARARKGLRVIKGGAA